MNTKSINPKSAGDKQVAGSATATATGAQSNVSKELHNFLADIEELIHATTLLTGEDLTRATEKISERIAAAKESVETMGCEVTHQARKTAADTNDYVHKQPWEAIGAGAAVAFLLGFVLASRH